MFVQLYCSYLDNELFVTCLPNLSQFDNKSNTVHRQLCFCVNMQGNSTLSNISSLIETTIRSPFNNINITIEQVLAAQLKMLVVDSTGALSEPRGRQVIVKAYWDVQQNRLIAWLNFATLLLRLSWDV